MLTLGIENTNALRMNEWMNGVDEEQHNGNRKYANSNLQSSYLTQEQSFHDSLQGSTASSS